MDRYTETFQTWDKIAGLYQDKFMDLALYNDTYDIFCENLTKKNPLVLEIGCGPGNITKYLLNKRPDLNIEAIDISPNMIALAKKNNPTSEFKVMDCRDIDKLGKRFDGIMCGFCLPYLSGTDCSKLIKDCGILLNENGIIYLSFVAGNPDDSGYQTGSSGDRTYFYYHNLSSINKNLAENGFETIDLLHKNYDKDERTVEKHTILIAKKN